MNQWPTGSDFTAASELQRIASYLYGQAYPRSPISLEEIVKETQIEKNRASQLLTKLRDQEILALEGEDVRLLGAGLTLFEEQCIPELVLGFQYCLDKYRAAVVRIVVRGTDGDPAAGTGFFVEGRPCWLITNRHVVERRTIIQIEEQAGDIVSSGPQRVILGPEELDLAAIHCPIPQNVKAIPIDWERGAARELDEVLVMSYPDILMTKPGLFSARGRVGMVGTQLATDRSALMISDVASGGSSGAPVLSRKGKVIGIVASEIETHGTGATRYLVSAVPSHYLREVIPRSASDI